MIPAEILQMIPEGILKIIPEGIRLDEIIATCKEIAQIVRKLAKPRCPDIKRQYNTIIGYLIQITNKQDQYDLIISIYIGFEMNRREYLYLYINENKLKAFLQISDIKGLITAIHNYGLKKYERISIHKNLDIFSRKYPSDLLSKATDLKNWSLYEFVGQTDECLYLKLSKENQKTPEVIGNFDKLLSDYKLDSVAKNNFLKGLFNFVKSDFDNIYIKKEYMNKILSHFAIKLPTETINYAHQISKVESFCTKWSALVKMVYRNYYGYPYIEPAVSQQSLPTLQLNIQTSQMQNQLPKGIIFPMPKINHPDNSNSTGPAINSLMPQQVTNYGNADVSSDFEEASIPEFPFFCDTFWDLLI